jgi:exopolysaccharide biosynthesis protein
VICSSLGLIAAVASMLLSISWHPEPHNPVSLQPRLGLPPMAAQTSSTFDNLRQGNRIVVNGQTQVGFWMQQGEQIGVSDMALRQVMGIELLNTASPTQQPVQWFSQPETSPLIANTWLTDGIRYLDLSRLAQQYNWQVNPQGNELRIQTPTSQIVGIRQGRQAWGDRIVIDLNQPAPWTMDEQRGAAVITINAGADSQVRQAFQVGPGNLLTNLQVQSQANQTQVQLQLPSNIRPRVWSLPDPHRIVIDIRPDSLVERDITWAPGIRWQQKLVTVGTAQFPVVMLTIDPSQTDIQLRPIRSNASAAPGLSPLTTMAQTWRAAAAINGGFFNRNNQLPLGVVRRDGQWLSGPILNRGAIAWDDQGNVQIGRLTLIETIRTDTDQQFPLMALNSGYVQAGISRYTPDWGTSYTSITDSEAIITVQNDQVVRQQKAGAAGQTSVPIPGDGYLLVVRNQANAEAALTVGTTVTPVNQTRPDTFMQAPNIMGGGPLLVQNQRIVLDAAAEQFSSAFIQQAAPRSAIATLANNHIALVAVHHRAGGPGPTLAEMAQLMQQLGATNALNLDGGSSTSLYLGGQLLDRSPRTAARVNNGIGIFVKTATVSRVTP